MCALCHNFANKTGETRLIATPWGPIRLCRSCELVHKAEIAEHFYNNPEDSIDEYAEQCMKEMEGV